MHKVSLRTGIAEITHIITGVTDVVGLCPFGDGGLLVAYDDVHLVKIDQAGITGTTAAIATANISDVGSSDVFIGSPSGPAITPMTGLCYDPGAKVAFAVSDGGVLFVLENALTAGAGDDIIAISVGDQADFGQADDVTPVGCTFLIMKFGLWIGLLFLLQNGFFGFRLAVEMLVLVVLLVILIRWNLTILILGTLSMKLS